MKRVNRAKKHANHMRRNPTPGEKQFRMLLKANSISGKFQAQVVISGFIVDYFCSETRLAVEIDGDIHLTQKAYDATRTAALNNYGCRVIRFTNDQVFNDMQTVIKEVKEALTLPKLTACKSICKTAPTWAKIQKHTRAMSKKMTAKPSKVLKTDPNLLLRPVFVPTGIQVVNPAK